MTVPLRAAVIRSALPPLRCEAPQDRPAIEALMDRAFGPGRFAKAAERLREGREPLFDQSFVAWDGETLAGCVRQWEVRVGGRPVVFLGPFAVDPAWRSCGLGAALIQRACAAAWAGGHDLVLLVGDAPYFQPLGFETVPAGRVVLPGPVDPRRVLARGREPGAAQALSGAVIAGW